MAIQEFERLKRLAKALNGNVVKVGWVDGNKTAAEAYAKFTNRNTTGKPQAKLSNPPSLAMIARTLHYGRMAGVSASGRKYPAIPARPFMNVAEDLIKKNMPKVYSVLMGRYLSGMINEKTLMQDLGKRGVSYLTEAMHKSEKYAPNSPITIKLKKGKNQPLFNTGTLINSADFEIKSK